MRKQLNLLRKSFKMNVKRCRKQQTAYDNTSFVRIHIVVIFVIVIRVE